MQLVAFVAFVAAFHLAPLAAAQVSPYAGEEMRDIKALSPDEIDGYLGGKGMGFAKSAELHGYPGPAHVLELSAELALTPEQRAQTESLFAAMTAEAIHLGRELVTAERKLDRLFASKTVTAENLGSSVTAIGALHARLREVHLKAHLAQVDILTPAQTARYSELRGYNRRPAHPGHHEHKH